LQGAHTRSNRPDHVGQRGAVGGILGGNQHGQRGRRGCHWVVLSCASFGRTSLESTCRARSWTPRVLWYRLTAFVSSWTNFGEVSAAADTLAATVETRRFTL